MIAIPAAPEISTRCVNFLIKLLLIEDAPSLLPENVLEIREFWLLRASCQYVLDIRQDQCFYDVSTMFLGI
jgi:hypothetical protein